jgi:hypothetical protein
VTAFLQASGAATSASSFSRFETNPERLGISSSIKQPSGAFAICVMASYVTLPGSAATYVEDTTQTSDQIKANRARFENDPVKMARYFASAQALRDSHDELLHDNPNQPLEWPAADQQRFGVYLGRTMAHEARHLFLAPHAASGLGADSPDPIDDKNYGAFSPADQVEIVKALKTLESSQSGKQLVPVFPQSVRADPDSFPF